jgi:hypothetical protein
VQHWGLSIEYARFRAVDFFASANGCLRPGAALS